jgi:hypothetical protein
MATRTPPADQESAQAGEWLPLAEARLRLGLSERTLRRRIASGRLPKRLRADGRVEVFVPFAGRPVLAEDGRAEETERQVDLLNRFSEAVRTLLEPLQHDIREARHLVERLAYENGMLIQENTQLKARLTALEQAVRDDAAS